MENKKNQTSPRIAENALQVAGADLNAPYCERRKSSPNYGNTNRTLIAVIVYLALFLDNILLTVIGK